MSSNPLRTDPTRTAGDRNAFIRDVVARFTSLRREVLRFVGEDDAFDLEHTSTKIETLAEGDKKKYRFASTDTKLDAFNDWLQDQIDAKVLSVGKGQNPFTAKYIDSAYKKGIISSYEKTKRSRKDVSGYDGGRDQFLRDSFGGPENLARVRRLATRSFERMKGLTQDMKSRMNIILADGLANSRGPRAVAKELSKTIEGMTKSRALTIARTEIIHAHAEGQLDSFEALGVDEVGVQAEWLTAGDDRVCQQCAEMEGKVFDIKKARGKIPLHPNCRCAWIPSDQEPKKKKGKPKAERVTKRTKSVPLDKSVDGKIISEEELGAMPVDRFGTRQGTSAAKINEAIDPITGISIEEAMALIGSERRTPVRGHLNGLVEKGFLERREDGRYYIKTGTIAPPPPKPAPPPVTPPPVVVPPPVAIQPPAPAVQPVAPQPAPAQKAPTGVQERVAKAKDIAANKDAVGAEKEARDRLREIEIANGATRAERQKLHQQQKDEVSKLRKQFGVPEDLAARRRFEASGKAPAEYEAKLQELRLRYENLMAEVQDPFSYDEEWAARNAAKAFDETRRAQLREAISIPQAERSEFKLEIDLKKLTPSNQKAFKEASENITRFISKERQPSPRIKVEEITGARAHYTPGARRITVKPNERPSIVAHELVHDIEFSNFEVSKRSKQFLKDRTKGETPKKMNDLAYGGYQDWEVALEDEWQKRGGDHYMGKVYNNEATELLSMGIERLMKDPLEFARNDPDYFAFLLEQLQGK